MNKKATRALTSRIRRKICPMSKRAQEEMVGFALIVVIVAVILLIFLSFYLRGSNKIEISSYEADGFIQSILQYTGDCEYQGEFLSVQDMIFEMDSKCEDDRKISGALKKNLEDLCEAGWNVGEDAPIKGYLLQIDEEESTVLEINKGNATQNYRGGSQDFTKRGKDYFISFKAYY